MTEFKSIREWIAEGVKLSDLLGYVDAEGFSVSEVSVTKEGMRVTLCSNGYTKVVRGDPNVAPPAPKRLSDEELLDKFALAVLRLGKPESAKFYDLILDRMLDRMKAKGPTRGEVGEALVVLLEEHKCLVKRWSLEKSDRLNKLRRDFLTMFPEAAQE